MKIGDLVSYADHNGPTGVVVDTWEEHSDIYLDNRTWVEVLWSEPDAATHDAFCFSWELKVINETR